MQGHFQTVEMAGYVLADLVNAGHVEVLGTSDDDAGVFSDCDLRSFIENRFGIEHAPAEFSVEARASWTARALGRGETLADPRTLPCDTACWLLDNGERVGTIALSSMTIGRRFFPISSLYIFPQHRRCGAASRALASVNSSAVAHGYAGMRLTTFWGWSQALRLYVLKLHMWSWNLKRGVELVWDADLPHYQIDVDEDIAGFSIYKGEKLVKLISARREEGQLIWSETLEMHVNIAPVVAVHARATMAIGLALHGWPLIRSREIYESSRLSDIGGPELLAYKIAVFAYLDAKDGFPLQNRIPGLPYEEVAEQWAAFQSDTT